MTAPRREHDSRRVPDITFNTKDAGGHVKKTDLAPWEHELLKGTEAYERSMSPRVRTLHYDTPIKVDSRNDNSRGGK